MTRLSRRRVLQAVGAVGAAGAAGAVGSVATAARQGDGNDGSDRPPAAQPPRGPPPEYEEYRTLRVPGEYDTIQAAVDDAEPRDLVLVGPGVYRETVQVRATPRLTIRGTDRNEVVLDGEFKRRNGVVATTDGVVMENLTARHYTYNGFYWTGVTGYRGSYLTAYNNGEYGVYAFDSVEGRFDECYASGHPDSGFYIGQCNPCHAVVTDCVSEHNALGYSGTNGTGYLTIRDSVWRENMAGIVPNTLDSEGLAPQNGIRIERNEILDNSNAAAPAKTINFPSFGTGITVAGGSNNEVLDNEIRGHVNFGVLVTPMIDKQVWLAGGNRVRGNRLSESGRADLALGAPTAGGNCFADNDFSTSRPGGIESSHGCGGGNGSEDGGGGGGDGGGGLLALADPWPTLVIGKNALLAELGNPPQGDWQNQPEPDPQEPMPDPERPPRAPVGEVQDG